MGKNRLLVICGPTATGKTELALHLSKVLNGVLISADSRQVYKYMDIGTGKDVKNILGYDLVTPNEEFSVSHYLRFANQKIQEIYDEGKIPILVGGTGLYIKAVIDGIETAQVPLDKELRKKLEGKSSRELFEILVKINPEKAESMNDSDRKNPRRLIRAIEIAQQFTISNFQFSKPDYDVLMIGLKMDMEELRRRINKRVDERIKAGFEKEVKFLKENGYWNGAPSRTLGYKDWPDVDKWKLEEFKYAKRQVTWFKKDKRIKWFDVTYRDKLVLKGVEECLEKSKFLTKQ